MNIAQILGVDRPESATLREARQRWPQWQENHESLRAVSTVDDLPTWSWSRDPRTDDVLRALARVGSLTGDDDPTATTILAWLMVPGANAIARQHGDLCHDAHELTAGSLWMACREAAWTKPAPIASTVLRATRRAVQAELGVGEGAKRTDRAWEATAPWSPQWDVWESAMAPTPAEQEPRLELAELLREATAAGVITRSDQQFLYLIANITDELEHTETHEAAVAKRGACGLGNRIAAHTVAELTGVSERTVRRRLRRCIDQLTAFASDGLLDAKAA